MEGLLTSFLFMLLSNENIHTSELLIKMLPENAELKRQLLIGKSRLLAILQQSPIAIAFTDTDLKILKTSQGFQQQFGYDQVYSLCNLLNQPSSNIFCSKENCLATLEKEGSIKFEAQVRHKKGHRLWVRISGSLLGQEISKNEILWFLEDISSHRTEQEQRKLAETVFEVSGEAMVILDDRGNLEKINPAMHRLIEYSKLELRSLSFHDLFVTSSNQISINSVFSLVKKEGQWKGQIELRKKSSITFPAQLTLNCINRPNGSVSHFVAILADISEFKAQEKILIHRANHDPLTGLPNRNEFFVRLNDSLAAAKRHQYTVALLYLVLDGFKPINDTLGHGRGDEVLQEVAVKLKHCIREIDTVARIGGDEFAIILNGTSEQQINATAERIIKSISIKLEESLHLSVSIGISLFPQDSINPLKLLQYADEAMYKVKHHGKQSYHWHNSETK